MLIGPPKNKLQWNFNQYSYIFSQENAFENVVWKMAAIFLGLYMLNDRLTRVLECTEELANPFDATEMGFGLYSNPESIVMAKCNRDGTPADMVNKGSWHFHR